MHDTKITFRYILACLLAVIITWLIHEFAHWFLSEQLGYEAEMYLNKVSPENEKEQTALHDNLISAAGPVITIIQGACVFLFLKFKKWNKIIYPLLFTAFYMRFLAGLVNIVNPNDEGRISMYLELGLFTIPIMVSALLFSLLHLISKKYKLPWKFQLATTLAVMLFSTALILADQFYNIRVL